LTTIQTTLAPYVLALTPAQRKQLPKMSHGTAPFVAKVMDYASSDPQFTPPYIDVPEMKKYSDAVTALPSILRIVDQIEDNPNDITMMAGSEAYVAALSYYNSVKMAAKRNTTGAKAIYDDLKKRFEGNGNRTTPAPATE